MKSNSITPESILKIVSTMSDADKASLITSLLAKAPTVAASPVSPADSPQSSTVPSASQSSAASSPTSSQPSSDYDITKLLVVPYTDRSYMIVGACQEMKSLFSLVSYRYAKEWGKYKLTGWAVSRAMYSRYDLESVIQQIRSSSDWRKTVRSLTASISRKIAARSSHKSRIKAA